jgi:hypothetical protein
MVLGAVALVAWPPALVTRGGYSELFYPPTLSVLAIAIGSCLLALSAVRLHSAPLVLGWIGVYGRASLVIYVVHTVLIAYVFVRLGPQPLIRFLGLYVLHLAVLLGLARLRDRISGRLPV